MTARKKKAGKLKPCPWCGHKPKVWSNSFAAEVLCDNRKCRVTAVTFDFATKEEAIAAWNKRSRP